MIVSKNRPHNRFYGIDIFNAEVVLNSPLSLSLSLTQRVAPLYASLSR